MVPLLLAMSVFAPTGTNVPDAGIPESLALERSAAIRDVRYGISLIVPEQRTAPVRGRVMIRFTVDAPRRIALDFSGPREGLRLRARGQDVAFVASPDHIVVPADAITSGRNELEVEFTAGDTALNRNDDFLYS